VIAGVSVAAKAAAGTSEPERKSLMRGVGQRADLHALAETTTIDGYAWPAQDLLAGIPAAIDFANRLLED
jgi:hypothetical protein